MNEKDSLLLKLLQEEWLLLEAAILSLQRSVDKCNLISLKAEYSFEEQESFDSLTSKFNRTSDLFTQKVIRTIWLLLHESFVPFIDLMNKGEKLELLQNAAEMIAIRDLRNQIAHEYIPEAVREIVPEVIEMSEHLFLNITCCRKFVMERGWLNN
jgi:hypothetical protein